MQEMSSAGNLEATIVQLQMDLERCRSLHQQEILEMKKTLETQQTSAESDGRSGALGNVQTFAG